jgi:dTDP-glucose pyrophosphorylase
MRALVLAAGRGTRLGRLTAQQPKPLIEVAGRPLIAHVLSGVASAGVEGVALVAGYRAAQLRQYLGDGARFGLAVTWFEQPYPEGTARAAALAREYLREEPFLFAWGDVLVKPHNYRAAIDASASHDGSLCVNAVVDPFAGAAVYVDAAGSVTRLIEKPPAGASTTRWNNAGIGLLPPAVWRHVDALEPSPRGEYDLPSAIAALIQGGARLKAVPITGPWFDVGTPESLAEARATFEVAHARP